ncbi:MAG: carbonic anhydrase, partial [Planctomycetaceae bacterium]
AKRGTHVLLDARRTDYIDPDVLSLIREFKEVIGPACGVQVSLRGFRDKHDLKDDIQFVDHSTRELQEQLTPEKVLHILQDGNERFRTGHRLDRDLSGQLGPHSDNQHPMAVILSGIHSATPTELIFDLGLGDAFCIRIAGNIAGPKVIGSIEYGCQVAGARLVVVMGNTSSMIVREAVDLVCSQRDPVEATGCQHFGAIIREIEPAIVAADCAELVHASERQKREFIEDVSRRNVALTVRKIVDKSSTMQRLIETGQVAVIGAVYDLTNGRVEFMYEDAVGLEKRDPICETASKPS